MKQIIIKIPKYCRNNSERYCGFRKQQYGLHVCIDPEKVMENRKALACRVTAFL